MYFTPESEEKVIREEVSHKLENPWWIHEIKFVETQLNLKLQSHSSKLVTLSEEQIREKCDGGSGGYKFQWSWGHKVQHQVLSWKQKSGHEVFNQIK